MKLHEIILMKNEDGTAYDKAIVDISKISFIRETYHLKYCTLVFDSGHEETLEFSSATLKGKELEKIINLSRGETIWKQ